MSGLFSFSHRLVAPSNGYVVILIIVETTTIGFDKLNGSGNQFDHGSLFTLSFSHSSISKNAQDTDTGPFMQVFDSGFGNLVKCRNLIQLVFSALVDRKASEKLTIWVPSLGV
jgi:hypothetical protein